MDSNAKYVSRAQNWTSPIGTSPSTHRWVSDDCGRTFRARFAAMNWLITFFVWRERRDDETALCSPCGPSLRETKEWRVEADAGTMDPARQGDHYLRFLVVVQQESL
jgi:hypothetical protein